MKLAHLRTDIMKIKLILVTQHACSLFTLVQHLRAGLLWDNLMIRI